ncbi:MAG: ATP-binding cassette domain-containing protein [Spirochaetota bacterium]
MTNRTTPLVRIVGLTKNLRDFSLSDVSLDLHAGTVHAIAGENGSGKSVLMQVVGGHHAADAAIIVFDASTSAMTDATRATVLDIVKRVKRRGGGVFFISHRVDEILSVADYVSVMDDGRVTTTRAVAKLTRDELVRIMAGTLGRRGYPRLKSRVGPVILSVRNLESDPVLKDVSFDVRRGEILGVTGLMGSGGTMEFDGRPVRLADPAAALELGISLVPEDRIEGIFAKQDLVFNVTMALDIKPGRQSDIVGRYSGGNQQKVLVSRWLAAHTQVCIMDEPTHGADGRIAADLTREDASKELIIACAMENGCVEE